MFSYYRMCSLLVRKRRNSGSLMRCWYGKRGLLTRQKRPIDTAKEAYWYGKRGRLIWQQRPIDTAKEAYWHGKRGLPCVDPRTWPAACESVLSTPSTGPQPSSPRIPRICGMRKCQKRPTYIAKEISKPAAFIKRGPLRWACYVCVSVKRDLLI